MGSRLFSLDTAIVVSKETMVATAAASRRYCLGGPMVGMIYGVPSKQFYSRNFDLSVAKRLAHQAADIFPACVEDTVTHFACFIS